MFAAILLDDGDRPYYINLKLEPWEGELMRDLAGDPRPVHDRRTVPEKRRRPGLGSEELRSFLSTAPVPNASVS